MMSNKGPPWTHELTGTGPLYVMPGVCATARMVFDAPTECKDITILNIELTPASCPQNQGE